MKTPDFDRAFGKTPAKFQDSIKESFERGERAMKLRHKITAMVSAAAALVVIVAVAALAAGGLGIGTPKEDLVFGQQITSAPKSLYQPTADMLDSIVYYNEQGNYFHTIPDCSGMQGAAAHSLREAYESGKGVCPVCGDAALASPHVVYSHRSGTYYHAQPDCSGMKNAPETTIEQAEADGKTACPVCIPKEEVLFVYSADGDTCYHAADSCAGSKKPRRLTDFEAYYSGLQPCSLCFPATPTPTPMPTLSVTATLTPMSQTIQRQDHWLDGMLQVHTAENGTYYHAIPDCSGMQGDTIILSRDGEAQGKRPCPACIPDIGDSSFRRIFGKNIAYAFPGYSQSVATLGTYSDRHAAYLNYFAHMRLDGSDSADFITIQLYPPASGLEGELQISTVGNSSLQSLLDTSIEPLGDLTNELIPLYLKALKGSPGYRHVSAITVAFDDDTRITGCSTVLDIDDETCYLVHWPMENGRFILPEVQPTPMPEPYVYCLDSSIFYHSDAACSGMRNPARVTRREAMQSGKQACPVCMAAQATPEPTPPAGATVPPTATLTPIPENIMARSTPEPIRYAVQTAMPVAVDEERSGMSIGLIGGADGPTSIFITQPKETAAPMPTPVPIDYPYPTGNITLAPLAEAFSRITGMELEEAIPGYILDYAEGYPTEAGSNEPAYSMWQFYNGDRTLSASLLDAGETSDGVLSINFPDSTASFRMMKQASEPLRTIYMKLAPQLLEGLAALTGGEDIQSRYLWDVFIHFNSAMEITTVEFVYAMADASTAHFSWSIGEGEPRLYNMVWIG